MSRRFARNRACTITFALALFAGSPALSFAQQVNVICPVQAEWCSLAATEFEKETGIRVGLTLKGSGESFTQIAAEKDNPKLDPQGFIPIGRVVEGMSVLDSLYDEYGDTPKYRLVATLGNEYLHRMFPRMDYIRSARVVGAPSAAPATAKP